MKMFSSAVVPLALAASTLASVFITSPNATTSWAAGQPATVSWIEGSDAPSLLSFGNATVGVYAGNANQQTILQTIGTFINVSAIPSFQFTPLASIGPNSGEYFIRFTSTTLKNGTYYAEAFSAKFTLTGMTGSFNSSVQAEINGQSTAPIGGPTSAASGSSGSATGSATGSASSPSSSAPASSSNGAGKPAIATGFVALAAAVVGASLL